MLPDQLHVHLGIGFTKQFILEESMTYKTSSCAQEIFECQVIKKQSFRWKYALITPVIFFPLVKLYKKSNIQAVWWN